MRGKGLVALVVVSAMSVVGLVATAGSASAAPTTPAPSATSGGQPPASCSAPPNSPDATAANRDHFISLWTPRLANKAWFTQFANLGAVPADIAAEGFNGMDQPTQAWLVACLVDNVLAVSGQNAPDSQVASYQLGLDLVIFGKGQIATARKQLAATTAPALKPPAAVPSNLTSNALSGTAADLAGSPSLTAAAQPTVDVTTPTTSTSTDFTTQASTRLQNLVGAPSVVPTKAKVNASASTTATTSASIDPNALMNKLQTVLNTPLVALILKAVADLEQLIGKIQQVLFTLPGLNLLASAFYRVCAESATQPLACSVSLPVGIPIPADVTGDNFPDVLAELLPNINLSAPTDFGVQFTVTRLFPTSGPLPAHIFVVYDVPIANKRIEYGYDGRASTLATSATTAFTLHNAFKALTGDVDVSAQVTSQQPGSTEALTFAVKDLVGGSIGVPPTEANPMAGAAQLSPFPTRFTLGAHLMHGAQDEDIFTVQSSTPSTVNAVIDQDTTTTTPKSHREFTALVDKLPTSVTVDLTHQGPKQIITYSASAPIAHVQATDTATPDVSHANSYTRSVYDVLGVPTAVQVTLQGAQDILYTASAKIPQVTFSTQTRQNGVLQQEITAQAHQIPTSVHVTNTTGADQTAVTYDANEVLPDVSFSMYDLNQDQTNLTATATSIPTHLQFTQTKSTGVFDFAANAGIGLIQAALTRGGGSVLHLTGDHATVYKRGNALGLELQLSGFQSAHFDGSQKTIVSLGLDPGGQAFDAIADLDSPNVLASVHVSKLPATMSVAIDPVGGVATYSASSIIPDLHGSFTQRDTGTIADLKLTQLPKNISLSFNTSGAAPQISYGADSRLGSIDGTYQQSPGGLSFHAVISDLAQFMSISGQDPIVFDARTSSLAAPGSSYLGQVLFDYATDGTFQSPPTSDDHLYLNTSGGATHAEVQYTGLQFLSADTSGGALHAEIRNVSPRLLRAYLTTDNLTLTGFIDKVPADVKIDQVGNDVQYHATSSISEIYTNVQRANGDAVSADVTGVPSSIDLLFDAANSKLDWTASSTAGGISAIAHLTPDTLGTSRAFDASLAITGIPAQWHATYGSGNVSFVTTGSGIGAISAQVSNHGGYHILAGDHLSAYFDQPSGDLDASLHISNLTKASFSKLTDSTGGGFVADLNMGSHGSFGLSALINLGSNKLTATGGFDHLPALIHLKSDGGRIQYTGDSNPTLTLAVAAGDPAELTATPAPANVNGISIRDGASGSGKAVKANVYLTGLPDSLDLNTPAGTYSVGNYHPSVDPLVVDAKLTTLAPQPLSLELQQVVGTASPVSFTFGPLLSSTAGDGTHSLSLNYTASRDLGSLTAEATYGNTDDAKLTISSIPGGTAPSISVNAAFGSAQKSIAVAMSHDISDITASYKHVGDATFAASVHLNNVPSAVNLLIGRGVASDTNKTVSAPDFTFTASHAGLNIDAMASADIVSPADITAAVNLAVTNLGQTVTGALNGTKLHITSSPATGSFLLTAAGTVQFNADLGFSGGGFENTGSLTVNANIKQLTLGFTNATDIGLDLGITTGLTGDFSQFTLGEDSDTHVTIEDHFGVNIDLPDPFGSVHIGLIDIGPMTVDLHNVIDHFHLDSNTSGSIFDIPVFEAILASCHVNINIRPHSEGNTAGSTISLGPPPDDGHAPAAWLITPDPNFFGFTLPDFALDIIAFFASPYGNEVGASFGCHFGP
ncbi:MAG: hypothetical protein JWO57_2052 [Pseudonocardiales bacterium]|nr:hypothetical protein [Pseudonocardiales bacterium]